MSVSMPATLRRSIEKTPDFSRHSEWQGSVELGELSREHPARNADGVVAGLLRGGRAWQGASHLSSRTWPTTPCLRGQPRHVCVANHDMFAVEAVAARCREAQMRSAVIGKSCASQEEMR
jgi:hypothetical protein